MPEESQESNIQHLDIQHPMQGVHLFMIYSKRNLSERKLDNCVLRKHNI